MLSFVADYYSEVSAGAVHLQWQIAKPVRLPHAASHYANGHGGRGDDQPNARTMASDVLKLLANEISDFAQFDSDRDGVIDAFVVVHAGVAAESEERHQDTLIWSHRGFGAAATAMSGQQLDEFVTVSEQSPPGVWCHELGHLLFNWPDLTEGTTSSGEPITHTWCLMSSGGWNGTNAGMPAGFSPAHPCAPLKIRQGWITPQTISQDGRYEAPAIEQTPASIRAAPAAASTAALFFENRQRIGFDSALVGEGLIV